MIIVTNAAGQLCNRLLLLAHAYATGLETNQKTVHLVAADIQKEIRLSGRLLKILALDTKPVYYYYEAVMSKLFGADFRKRNREKMEQKRTKMSRKGIHILNNWYYRDYESLFKHHGEIVSAFAPVEEYASKAELFLMNVRETYPEYTLVGVHIRRGDYKFWQDGRFYYDNEAFGKWMAELEQSMRRKTLFLVFSNEPVELKELGNDLVEIIKGPGHPVVDLYVMAQCDYIFGPPSSYSWWAAFYGEKKYLTVHSRGQHIREQDFALVKGEEFNPGRYYK